MTVTLNLKPEIEAGLLARAQASGMGLEEYLVTVFESAARTAGSSRFTPEQRASAYEKWSANHRTTPPLSDFAVSREGIYQDNVAP